MRAVDTLEALLRQEIATYTSLVNRIPLKVALIKKNQAAQLERITTQEETDLRRLVQLEAERAELTSEIVTQWPDTPATLSGLLSRIERPQLRDLGVQLRTLVERLHEGNRLCAMLLNASLDYLGATMEIIASAAATPTGYGTDEPVSAPSLILDRRA